MGATSDRLERCGHFKGEFFEFRGRRQGKPAKLTNQAHQASTCVFRGVGAVLEARLLFLVFPKENTEIEIEPFTQGLSYPLTACGVLLLFLPCVGDPLMEL